MIIANKLPWEDLLIGFQCRINRKPNIYNNDFWQYFSNKYIDKVNFRYENPCDSCEVLFQKFINEINIKNMYQIQIQKFPMLF